MFVQIKTSMAICSRFVSLLFLLSATTFTAQAQSLLPQSEGQLVKLNANIDFPRGSMSGICALRHDGEWLKGSLFNEFGISALDFTYHLTKRKVKIVHAIAQLNKWYIKLGLRHDLVQVMEELEKGDTIYVNQKRKITYQFSKMNDNDTEE